MSVMFSSGPIMRANFSRIGLGIMYEIQSDYSDRSKHLTWQPCVVSQGFPQKSNQDVWKILKNVPANSKKFKEQINEINYSSITELHAERKAPRNARLVGQTPIL